MKTFKVTKPNREVFHVCVPVVDAEHTKQELLQNYCEVEEVSNDVPF